MSRTYQALKKAEREKIHGRTVAAAVALDDREAPAALRDPGLATRLEFEKMRVWLMNPGARGAPLQTVMVAACHAATGTTTTAAQLAATLAQGGARVLAVDANFRTPALNRLFQLRNKGGLSDILQEGPVGDEFHILPSSRDDLFVLPTGPLADTAADLFERPTLKEFLARVKAKFDFAIFDAAPLLDFPDSYALAPHVDGVILLAEADKTSVRDAWRATRDIERAGGRLLGVVLNRQRDHVPRFLRRFLGAD